MNIVLPTSMRRFQSTLSQGERLDAGRLVPFYIDISIHALARRATCLLGVIAAESRNFNPRSRKESDGDPAGNQRAQSDISIHALARRATVRFWP